MLGEYSSWVELLSKQRTTFGWGRIVDQRGPISTKIETLSCWVKCLLDREFPCWMWSVSIPEIFYTVHGIESWYGRLRSYELFDSLIWGRQFISPGRILHLLDAFSNCGALLLHAECIIYWMSVSLSREVFNFEFGNSSGEEGLIWALYGGQQGCIEWWATTKLFLNF